VVARSRGSTPALSGGWPDPPPNRSSELITEDESVNDTPTERLPTRSEPPLPRMERWSGSANGRCRGVRPGYGPTLSEELSGRVLGGSGGAKVEASRSRRSDSVSAAMPMAADADGTGEGIDSERASAPP